MRHAQYRQELADAVAVATGQPSRLERSDQSSTPPAIAVQWTGSQLSRSIVGGWVHSYDVEIRIGEQGPALDTLVAVVATAVAGFDPNTSNATASPPVVRPVQVLDAEISYPAVLVSTTVTEPSTD